MSMQMIVNIYIFVLMYILRSVMYTYNFVHPMNSEINLADWH